MSPEPKQKRQAVVSIQRIPALGKLRHVTSEEAHWLASLTYLASSRPSGTSVSINKVGNA